jgi:hypothetical protein
VAERYQPLLDEVEKKCSMDLLEVEKRQRAAAKHQCREALLKLKSQYEMVRCCCVLTAEPMHCSTLVRPAVPYCCYHHDIAQTVRPVIDTIESAHVHQVGRHCCCCVASFSWR